MLRDECHDAEKWVTNRWSRPPAGPPPMRPFRERHQVQEVCAPEPEEEPQEPPAEAVEALNPPRQSGTVGSKDTLSGTVSRWCANLLLQVWIA